MFTKSNHQLMVRVRRAVVCLFVPVFSLFTLLAHAGLSANVSVDQVKTPVSNTCLDDFRFSVNDLKQINI